MEPRANKHDLLRGGHSNSGISSLRSPATTMAVLSYVRHPECLDWVGHPDDGSTGDGTGGVIMCRWRACNPYQVRIPGRGVVDSEICGDGGG
ncbi:hypothetical protein Tco_1546259 [Tanacetum coccineum]